MIKSVSADCSGCGACAAKCPVNAITMKSSEDGFYIPQISEKCINCGACVKVCPMKHRIEGEGPQAYYACRCNDPEVVQNSSSGGIFPLLAEAFLREEGYVFGCAWRADGLPWHIGISDVQSIPLLTKSKYVQSDMNGVLGQVKTLLAQGKRVLFSGTPCQIAGLRSFLGKPYQNLLTVDFICHGVPSPKVYKTYIDYWQQEYGTPVNSVCFRDKSKGWEQLQLTITFADGRQKSSPAAQDSYYRAFLGNLSLNKSCGSCRFNALPRPSDLTLGDFWRVEKHHERFADNKGASCVVINTLEGAKLFEEISGRLDLEESSKSAIMDGNPFLDGHCKIHPRWDRFFNALEKEPFSELVSKCLKPNLFEWAWEVLAYKLTKR